ncbi:hypothetical protein BsWGS_11794 [Bradybaena similaris]
MSEVVRPWKVWSVDRELKKSVAACNLQELIEKGCCKLGLSPTPQPRVVLEEDGTEVDEDEYLSLLPTNTAFMFLQNKQRWSYPDWIAPEARYETNAASVKTDASDAASVKTDASDAASVKTDASDAASVKDAVNSLSASVRWHLEDDTWEQTKRMAAKDFAEMDRMSRRTRRLLSRSRKPVSASRRATLPRGHVLHQAVPRISRK